MHVLFVFMVSIRFENDRSFCPNISTLDLQAAMNKGNAFSLLEIKIILSLHKLGMIKVVPYNIHFLKLLFTPKKPNYAIPNRILLRTLNRSI